MAQGRDGDIAKKCSSLPQKAYSLRVQPELSFRVQPDLSSCLGSDAGTESQQELNQWFVFLVPRLYRIWMRKI